jgi:hypothetical protein
MMRSICLGAAISGSVFSPDYSGGPVINAQSPDRGSCYEPFLLINDADVLFLRRLRGFDLVNLPKRFVYFTGDP